MARSMKPVSTMPRLADRHAAKAWAAYAALRLGRTGVAGAVLLVACGAVLGWHALRADEEKLASQIAQARDALRRMPATAAAPSTARGLLAQLPAAEQAPVFIEDVHRGAAEGGVQIERAEYRMSTLASGQVLRSQMVLPVAGRYPAVWRWLTEVLHDHPSAALDELSLQRNAPGSEQLRVRVVLSHYSRSSP